MKLKLNLQFKLFLFVIILIVLLSLGLGWVITNQQREILEFTFQEKTKVITQILNDSIGAKVQLEDREKLQSFIHKLIQLNPDITRIDIVIPTIQGLEVIASNEHSSIGKELGSKVTSAYKTDTIFVEILEEPKGTSALSVFAPIHLDNQEVGIYHIQFSLASLEKSIFQNQIQYFCLIIGSIFLILLLILFFARKEVIEPIGQLKKGMEIISKGDFNYKINIERGDEIGELAQGLNEMTEELEGLYKNLEGKVRERTIQLDEKVKELEKLNKAFVGRELVMLELKKEIDRLKEELRKQSKDEK